MSKLILDGQEYGGGGGNIVKLTQAEYNALSNDKLSDDNIYLITDAGNGELSAENMSYDGSQTVKDAIDELNSNLPFKFGIDGDGNYGYYGADDSLIPFKRKYPSNYIYAYGDLCYDTTGGWRHPTHSTYYGLSFLPDQLFLCTYTSTFPMNIMTENKIDFTNYSKLKMRIKIITDSHSGRGLGVFGSSATHYDLDNCTNAVSIGSYGTHHESYSDEMTLEFDVSSINTSYYLRLQAYLADVRIYEIWME